MSDFDIKDALALRAPDNVDLADIDPADTGEFEGKKKKVRKALDDASAALDDELYELQEKLFATARAEGDKAPSILIVLQGMDTSGKGGAIRHVMGVFDPQGVDTVGFGAPTDEEKKHDFLWRIRKHDPQPGRITVFDRSHYEDVLIQRVHKWVDEKEVACRFEAIRDYEKELADSGTVIIKAFLHISKEFQKENLLERLDNPDKHWKFAPGDIDERAFWDDYMAAYADAINETNADHAPWYVLPSDTKRYARLALKYLVLDALRSMELSWPEADFNVEEQRSRLEAEDGASD